MFNVGQLTGEKVEVPKSMTRQALYERRKKAHAKPVPQPWDFMTSAQASDLVLNAYRLASWHVWQEMLEPSSEPFNHFQLRQLFANHLSDYFADGVAAQLGSVADVQIDSARGTWSLPDLKESLRKVRLWKEFCSEVPEEWKPQYPLYLDEARKKLTPAGATNASGVVTNADEGNVNEHDSKG